MPLSSEDIKSYEKKKVCHTCKKGFRDNDKNKKKVRDHCRHTGNFRGAAHSERNLRHNVPKKIPTVFDNGSTYDYHFVIKKIAEEFKGDFECLGENTENLSLFQCLLKNKMTEKLHIN